MGVQMRGPATVVSRWCIFRSSATLRVMEMLIIDPATDALLFACNGMYPDGSCRLVAPGETVACAGCSVVGIGAALPRWVAPGSKICPLAVSDER
jgi:hypothetical protein